jgi:D-3-phosphoglycerate dehydrogenase
MLLFARKLEMMNRDIRSGKWLKPQLVSLSETTLGVIGVGNCGKAVVRRAVAFGMNVLGNDVVEMPADFLAGTGIKMLPLEELLSQSDFVSINATLNPSSFHLINDRTLSLMKKTAYLINVARGPIVEEAALARALDKGKIGGAALDVFEVEPLPADSQLRRFDNCWLAPHNANSSPVAAQRVHENTIGNLLKVLRSQQ